jgi:hypothetical protein
MMEGLFALASCLVLPTSLADLWSAPRLRGRLFRRVRYDRWDRELSWSAAIGEIVAPYQTVPYGTDSFREFIPGNELPGHLQYVPTGQAVPRVDLSSILST